MLFGKLFKTPDFGFKDQTKTTLKFFISKRSNLVGIRYEIQ